MFRLRSESVKWALSLFRYLRYSHRKHSSAFFGAVDADGAPMNHCDVLDDGKAKTCATEFATASSIDSVKTLKQSGEMESIDSRSFITHAQFDVTILELGRNSDPCIGRRIFERV